MPEATKLPIKSEAETATPGPSWAPFENLRSEIDRLFDNFHPLTWRLPFGRSSSMLETAGPRGARWSVVPAVDVSEREKEFAITAELPGMSEDDIEVKLSNGTLTIRGEKKEEKEERKKDYYLSERRYGSFTRSFRVPDGVDTANIEAKFANGVLTVTLPKTAEAQKSETIAVKAA